MTAINRLRAPHNTACIHETAKFLFKRRLRAGAKYHSHDGMSAPSSIAATTQLAS